jgi:wyosine [tRNA(Phe)-imidazoG37] synthetase (radical SAM superfamily)
MKYVFGPVPSRRLGKSLGIDPIPLKTCNWNCVYCQLGRTRPLSNNRCEYTPPGEILAELEQVLQASQPDEIDWVTFVGSGEPTLHSGLGWMIQQVKAMTSLPVAVITNGALLYLPEIRDQLKAADAVMPSLDAGKAQLYKQINRPWPKLTFQRHIDGLISFRKLFSGKLWVEVMLMEGLNDNEEALKEIAALLEQIRPNQVHINLPIRPPAEAWVYPASEARIALASTILGNTAVIVPSSQGPIGKYQDDELAESLVGILTRHPMQEDDLIAGLSSCSPEKIHATLKSLEMMGRVQSVKRYGVQFWSAGGTRYGKDMLNANGRT